MLGNNKEKKMFYLIGTINQVEYSLSYTKGKLSGDPEAMNKAQEESLKDHGDLGLMPESITSNYLDNEHAAYNLIKNYVFDEITRSNKDWKFRKDIVH